MTISDVASDLTHGTIAYLPHLAPRCGCADDDVIAYRDDDGDWTCTSCGRRTRAQATDREDGAQRPDRLGATLDSELSTSMSAHVSQDK
jgi:hypothetical protein